MLYHAFCCWHHLFILFGFLLLFINFYLCFSLTYMLSYFNLCFILFCRQGVLSHANQNDVTIILICPPNTHPTPPSIKFDQLVNSKFQIYITFSWIYQGTKCTINATIWLDDIRNYILIIERTPLVYQRNKKVQSSYDLN